MDDIQVRGIKANLTSAEKSGDTGRMLSALTIAMIETVENQAAQGVRLKNIEHIVEKRGWTGRLIVGAACTVGTACMSVLCAYVQARYCR